MAVHQAIGYYDAQCDCLLARDIVAPGPCHQGVLPLAEHAQQLTSQNAHNLHHVAGLYKKVEQHSGQQANSNMRMLAGRGGKGMQNWKTHS